MEFFEVPVRREDGSEGSHFINMEAISYVDMETDAAEPTVTAVRVYLNNGYWFTVLGAKATEMLRLIQQRANVQFREQAGEN